VNFIENFIISLSVLVLVAIFGALVIRVVLETRKGKRWIENDPN
jgi:hypothetical protein